MGSEMREKNVNMEKMPIYLVITEYVNIYPWSGQYSLRFIVKVLECDLSEIEEVTTTIVKPLYDDGRHIQTEILLREPPSPFHDWKEIELAQLKEREERDRQDRIDYLERTKGQEKPGSLPGD